MSETSLNLAGPAVAAMSGPSIAILATQAATLAAAAGATVPSGAATIVLATDVGAIALALCDPVAFFTEGGQWSTVSQYCNAFTNGLELPIVELGKSWQGPAAEAFVAYIDQLRTDVFPKIAALADAEKALLEAAGWAVVSAAMGFVALNVPLIVTALMLLGLAPATLGSSLAGQWPAAASWAALILAAVGFEIKLFTDLNKQLTAVTKAGETLSNYLNSSITDLSANNLRPPDLNIPPVNADIDELSEYTSQFGPQGA
ncbi:hypothetical protein [Aestuariimicrobium sp. Y1814]|uniref:hypothetical protein n=1 Tax=Aestuariimicrobium sp. Y1814 TaxID=3418742 RepID=UPI003DA76B7F